jgi:hypothetical protein
MSTDDRGKLRAISFREFADRWLDGLDPGLDPLGDIWVSLFGKEIKSHLQGLADKVERLLFIIQATGAEEAYQAFASEFAKEGASQIPSYESLLPAIRALGGKDEDTAMKVFGIFEYAQKAKGPQGYSGAPGNNIDSDTTHP